MNNEVKDRILEIFNNNQKIKDNPTCYIYNLKQISDQINEVQKYACKNVSLYYAMKANPNKKVISHVLSHECVKGIEIASTGELDIALDSGLESTDRILFTGPGKTPAELEDGEIADFIGNYDEYREQKARRNPFSGPGGATGPGSNGGPQKVLRRETSRR